MKRIPEHNSRKETQNKSASDLKGFTELGMKREALKLARRKLKQIIITRPINQELSVSEWFLEVFHKIGLKSQN
jgi:hypothetical protein